MDGNSECFEVLHEKIELLSDKIKHVLVKKLQTESKKKIEVRLQNEIVLLVYCTKHYIRYCGTVLSPNASYINPDDLLRSHISSPDHLYENMLEQTTL